MKKRIIIILAVIICLTMSVTFPLEIGVFAGDTYLEQLESILKDVKYASSRSDAIRAEQKLRRLEKECLADPRCTAEDIRKINECIDAVQRTYK
jgi:5-bromo-4-chloroindolyl phosphate hydrolysis protein